MKLLDLLGRWTFETVHRHNLVYAACWEDPAVDCQALRIGTGDTVLTISSAGCNALHYLLSEPRRVHAIDLNYRQNALLELKLAAIRQLEWHDFFAMFGHGTRSGARSLYVQSLRNELTDSSRRFWDQRIGWFDSKRSFYSYSTSGQFALGFRRYVDYVLRLGRQIDALIEATDLVSQIRIYEGQLKDRFWKGSLEWLLRREALLAWTGIPPEQRTHALKSEDNLLDYLKSKAEHVIYHLPLSENYFWRLYLQGRFTESCCPEYLKRANFEKLQDLVDRVRLHTMSVQRFLEQTTERITCFSLLDHMDWLSGADATALTAEWQSIVDRGEPGARLVWRSLAKNKQFVDRVAVRVGDRQHTVGSLLHYDSRLADELADQQRVNVYGGLFVAELSNLTPTTQLH